MVPKLALSLSLSLACTHSQYLVLCAAPLAKHLEDQNAMFMHFTFRWMNCLLMRELPLKHIVRIWDTYLAEGEDFSQFHVYVCAAFLIHWSAQLRQLDFQPLMLYLQRLPTQNWGEKEIDMLLSQAYVLVQRERQRRRRRRRRCSTTVQRNVLTCVSCRVVSCAATCTNPCIMIRRETCA